MGRSRSCSSLVFVCLCISIVSAWSPFKSKGPDTKPKLGGRIVDLLNGEHFDDIVKDTPNELRPGGLVLFFRSQNKKCYEEYEKMGFNDAAERSLPSRARLFLGVYDMDMHDKRLHTDFSPEQDLPKRIGLTEDQCPALVYIPQKCDGHTVWCTKHIGGEWNMDLVGCEDFQESCQGWRVWDGKGSWFDWAKEQIDSEPWPALDNAFDSYSKQEQWIRAREKVTTNTHLRNNFLGPSLPKFSETGTKMMKIPDELRKELESFYYSHTNKRKNEAWDISGATQMNFHEVGTDLVYLDLDPFKRDDMANRLIKPILEEWSGQKLKLNAFYGIREYYPGAWLRNHIDRIDTHIISATISLLRPNATKPWPIETVSWEGKRFRFQHRPGEMLLYESSTRPHGRPYKMEDGVHVGCFVHFSPKDEHVFRKQLSDGRRYLTQNRSTEHYFPGIIEYPSDPVRVDVIQTPEIIQRRRGQQVEKSRSRKKNPDELSVKFVNDLDTELTLYWVSFEDQPVRNALIETGDTVFIQTFPTHRFFFAPSKTVNSVPPKEQIVTMQPDTKIIRASAVGVHEKLHTAL